MSPEASFADNATRTIVCATDLTETSRHALDTAIELSDALGAIHLHVLHVHETVDRIESVQDVEQRWTQLRDELEGYVREELVRVSRDRALPRNAKVITAVRYGKAYRQILHYAVEANASWIVVGTHGRTGLGHVLGSVAERIVRHAPCTVIVAKSPDVRDHLIQALP